MNMKIWFKDLGLGKQNLRSGKLRRKEHLLRSVGSDEISERMFAKAEIPENQKSCFMVFFIRPILKAGNRSNDLAIPSIKFAFMR